MTPRRPGYGHGVVKFMPQVSERNVTELAAQGIRLIVNNRPEEENPSASGPAIRRACVSAGVDYLALPMRGWPDDIDIQHLADRLSSLKKGEDVALYCLSGKRSAVIWALAEQRLGRLTSDEIRAIAAHAGFDLSALPL